MLTAHPFPPQLVFGHVGPSGSRGDVPLLTPHIIAAGQDVVTVSRRLGHAKPTITLNVYSHLFRNTDADCADAIEVMLAN